MAAVQPTREESFNGKEEVDEAQHASNTAGNGKLGINEKDEDLDIGAQVRIRHPTSTTDRNFAYLLSLPFRYYRRSLI